MNSKMDKYRKDSTKDPQTDDAEKSTKDSQSSAEIRRRGEAIAKKIQASQMRGIDEAIERDEAFDKKHGLKLNKLYDLDAFKKEP